MRLLVVVNRVSEVREAQTTSMIARSAAARGHDTRLAGVADLGLDEDGFLVACARRVDAERGVEASVTDGATPFRLVSGDGVLVRTNPGREDRPWSQGTALDLLRLAERTGVVVLNPPDALARAASKLFLCGLPAHTRPRTVVSRDVGALRRFIADAHGPTVIKPLVGTRGRDVFRVDGPAAPNLAQILDVLVRDGFAMAQDYIEEARDGDTRLLLLEGEPLRVGDAVAAIRRVPGGDDFRSNVHVGGQAAPGVYDARLARLAADVGPLLRDEGLFLVGLDVIGTRIVEVNVYSPGGLFEGNAFAGVDFVVPIVDAVERRVTAGR